MTPQERKVFELAFEFIERVNKDGWILADFEPQMYAVMTAINEALAKPQRTWVDLTDEDYDLLSDRWWKPNESEQALIDWVIERLKEKNT